MQRGDEWVWGFAPHSRRLAQCYRPQVYRWTAARTAASGAVWVLAVFSGAFHTLHAFFAGMKAPGWIALSAFLLCIYILVALWNLVWQYAGSYLPGRRFGLITATPDQWLRDRFMSFALTAPVFVGGGLMLQQFMKARPHRWWVRWSLLWVVGSFVLIYAFPVLILPLFCNAEPLSEGSLRERLMALSETAGFDVRNICAVDLSRRTSAINAFVTGIGSTRKIMLADNLLKGAAPAEVEAILAHELGHHKLKHISASVVRTASLSVLVIWASARLTPPLADVAGYGWPPTGAILPLVGLLWVVMWGLLTPVVKAISRRAEKQCDDYALQVCSDPSAFAAAMVRAADSNLADIFPSRAVEVLLFSHPPVTARIAAARRRGAQPERTRSILREYRASNR